MARNVLQTEVEQHIVSEDDAQGLPAMLAEAQQLTVAQAAVMDSFDVIKALGRIEAGAFYETVSQKIMVETAIQIRQGKKYKGLPFKGENGETETISSFEQFCEVFLHKSARRVQQLISNYNLLGPELYEQAEKLGFQQRDYSALKALPDDDRALIAQAIEEESLEKALDILQEMSAKHVREKEQLTKQAEELTHTVEAKDKVIKDKTGVIDRQAEQLALLETKQRNVSAEQRLIDARSNLQITAANIKASVMSSLRRNLMDLQQLSGDHSAFAGGLLIEIVREVHILRDEYGLPATVSEDLTPEWMREGALDEIEKQYAEFPTMSDEMADFLSDEA